MNAKSVRRAVRVTGGFWAGLLACTALAVGVLDAQSVLSGNRPSPIAVLFFASVLVVLVGAIARRVRFKKPSARSQRVSRWMAMAATFADLELALALIAAVYTSLLATGGLQSPFYPLLYALIAFSATFQARIAAIVTLVAALSLEAALLVRTGSTGMSEAIFHSVFLVSAAAIHGLFLRGMVQAYRKEHSIRLSDELQKQRESARDYRLISVALGAESRAKRTRREEEDILRSGSLASISSSIYHSLSLLQQALESRSCVLLWSDPRSETLKLKEVVSDCDAVIEQSWVPLSGVVKAVAGDKKTLLLKHCKPGQIAYYESSFVPGAFMGVPVMEGQYLRGILCVEREEPFLDKDRELAESGASQVLQAIRSEQVFNTVERAKYEHERFYQASSMLCKALTLDQVQDTAFSAVSEIVEYDVAVISVFDRQTKKHRVSSVRSSERGGEILNLDRLTNLEFKNNSGLVSMVVKNKHYLPTAGALRDRSTPVFDTKVRVEGESILVLPLLSADETLGTLTLISCNKGQFRKDAREMLGVICNQVAVSMENALMYKRMETMATTDGLTNLTNHRSFQERFRDLVERSERHGHKAAMLLCDVDHFKNVNDSYGHPVGDEVLRQVAKVLREAVRKIDIPARYGGEEFAVVLEATDLEGALGLAERIREDVGNLILESEHETFQITMSIGVSAFPADGVDTPTLIERADMSLYHAKESGRNQVVCYRDFEAHRRLKAS